MKRYLLMAVVLVGLLGGGAVAYRVISDEDPPEKRGSANEEFDPTAKPEPPKPPPRKLIAEPWPTYGYDNQRTKVSPYEFRPPYRRTWRVDARDTIEFPPSAAYGNVYMAQQRGLFFALNGKTGKPIFKTKNTGHCSPSSPTLANGTIYQSYMHREPCEQFAEDKRGFVLAMDARTGRKKWRYNALAFESSPLLQDGILYVGSWDGNVHAIRAKTGRRVWTFQTGERVNTSGAYSKGRVFFGNQNGELFAINAKTGKLAWKASQATEFFYASPAAAYGRVFIGSSDGTMYAYGARTGKLLWARPLGTYIYSGAAIYDKKVYAGSYDGKFYALDAATGDVRWQRTMASSVHAPPVVMDGLVYAATCATCGSAASRFVKMGKDGTTAFNAKTGKKVWSNNAGKYASPIIADQDRVYLVGRSYLYALEKPKKKATRAKKAKASRQTR